MPENKGKITPQVNSRALGYQITKTFKTSLLLKLLRKNLPNGTPDGILPDAKALKSEWLHTKCKEGGGRVGIYYGRIIIISKGQKKAGEEYEWEVEVFDPNIDTDVEPNIVPVNTPPINTPKPIESNGIIYRSQSEYKVAQALEHRGILFFANSRCRIRSRLGKTETKEPDFVVFYKGSARILEVDGADYHQQPSLDYKRDRTFERYGIKVTRFTASECFSNPDEVVKEFLELFSPA